MLQQLEPIRIQASTHIYLSEVDARLVLIVDDFGVEYVGRKHADHLLAVLNQHYEISED